MQIANQAGFRIRSAGREDERAISRLLESGYLSHMHADWHSPADWLEGPGCVLAFDGRAAKALAACLAAAADSRPAAWVRLAAVASQARGAELLAEMFAAIEGRLRALGVRQIGWLASPEWPAGWLEAVGFRLLTEVITLARPAGRPAIARAKAQIRPAVAADLPAVAALEALAFEPLWRHNLETLRRAQPAAAYFELALVGGEAAGYCYAARGQGPHSAHIVRLAVAPDYQNRGVGSALLAHALDKLKQSGFRHISLNTQADNGQSLRLYRRFGFEELGDRWPVWLMEYGAG
ncbi:MAG: GNAT family N-acetyltransferase [Candidatus Promineifilaceae bacterium]